MSKLKMKRIVLCWLFAYAGEALGYNATENFDKYSGYGEEWMFFPDGNEKPTVALLKLPQLSDLPSLGIYYEVPKSVKFRLYTRHSAIHGEEISTSTNLRETFFNPKLPTKCMIHGWMSSGDSDTCISIKDSYLKFYNYNVILVDWSAIAGNVIYPIPMSYTKEVAKYYAIFIDYLIKAGTNPKQIHLIGHSLGAHISGFTSRNVKSGRLGRVTGLDPAFPGFNLGSKLSPNDAFFVDIIHSCAGVLGIPYPVGIVDFYPNSGFPPQPGCHGLPEIIEACSHGRSWKLFNESINTDAYYYAKKCSSWETFIQGSCKSEEILMGDRVPKIARGVYYLRT